MTALVPGLLALVACGGGHHASRSGGFNPFGSSASGGAAGKPAPAAPRPQLHAGDCFDVDVFAVGVAIDPRTIRLLPCDKAHEHEVIADYTHPGPPRSPFPGAAALDSWAGDHCISVFPGYVGVDYEHSTLDVATLQPDEAGWADGDRDVACSVHDADFKVITGSVKASGK